MNPTKIHQEEALQPRHVILKTEWI